MQGKVENRIISFDVARALAIFLVVLCHAAEVIHANNAPTSNYSNAIFIVAFTLGRIGVPLFLFLTGALVLKKQINSDDDVLHFYKKNLLPLFIVNAVWVLLYNLYFLIGHQGQEVTLGAVIRELFLIDLVPLPNMWYMPMILGMYVGIPFVAKIVKSFSGKSLVLGGLVVFVLCFIIPFINVILQICGVEDTQLLSPALDISFLGGTYGLYILIGYLLTNKKVKIKIKTSWLLLIALLSFGITCLIQLVSLGDSSHFIYRVWYNFPFLLICGACLFGLINKFDYKGINKKALGVINFISRASLGIFFLHIITQQLVYSCIISLGVMSPIKLMLLSSLNFALSAIICYLLSKIKFISRWVLLIK